MGADGPPGPAGSAQSTQGNDDHAKKSRTRRARAWIGGILAATVLAVATAFGTGLGQKLSSDLTGNSDSGGSQSGVQSSNPAGTPKSPAQTGLPILKPPVDLCAKLEVGLQCTLDNLDSGTDAIDRTSDLKKAPGCPGPAYLKWAATNAVRVGNQMWLTITSSTNAVVVIANFAASIVKRSPPLHTPQLVCAGGSDIRLYVTVYLDTNPATVTYYCNDVKCPEPQYVLHKGDTVQVLISAGSTRYLTQWHGTFNIIVNGRVYPLDLGNNIVTPSISKEEYCQDGGAKWVPCASQ